MNPNQPTRSTLLTPPASAAPRSELSLPTWRLNLMRVGYLVMGVGLVITKWPEFLAHEPWELMHGTVLAMLVAMSVLALVGLRFPQQMLPVLLFEVGWKVLWLGAVALAALAAVVAAVSWGGDGLVAALVAGLLVQVSLVAYESVFVRAGQDVPLS